MRQANKLMFMFLMLFVVVCSSCNSGDNSAIIDGDDPNYDGDVDDDSSESAEKESDDSTVEGDTEDSTVIDGDESENDSDGDTDGETEEVDTENIIDGDEDGDISESDEDIILESIPCSNNQNLSYPELTPSYNTADFGAVAIMDSNEIALELCNSSGVDLSVTSVQFARGTSHEYYKYHKDLPLIIPPGFAVPILLSYVPVDNLADEGTLVILSDDANNPELKIPLVSSVQPAALLKTVPQIAQFHSASVGQTTSKTIEISNIGNESTSITLLELAKGQQSPYTIKDIRKNNLSVFNSSPWDLAADENITVEIEFQMADSVEDDILNIDWLTEDGTKRSTVNVMVGNDAMCAIPQAGMDQFVDPLDNVLLNGSRSYDPNGSVQAYMWQFVKKPDNAFRATIKDMNGNTIEGQWVETPNATFYAELSGEYVVQLTTKDSEEICTGVEVDFVTIWAKPESTIHVQLVWETQNNDQDIHLIRPGGQHVRDGAESTEDCHYANCNTINGRAFPCPPRGCPGPYGTATGSGQAPDWGIQEQRFDDPFLDIDDIEMKGPENINYSAPELGDFKVTVEHYSGESQQNEVKVLVFVFGVLEASYTLTDVIPVKHHWNVCWIKVHSPTDIEVVEINTSEPSEVPEE